MTKNILKIIVTLIIGMVGGIFSDQVLGPKFFYQYPIIKNVTETKEIYVQENTALKEAIEKVEKTVVGVRSQTQKGIFLEGSGLIVTSDGLMVTLAELVPQGSDFSFFVEGTPHQINGGGQILKRDLKENLALVKLEKENLATLSFADLEKIKLGERVFLVGLIFEKGKPSKIANVGIIKSFTKDLIKTNIFEKYTLAGSPLFNIEGQVLGINTIDLEGKVIAIPISKIKQFIGL